MGKIGGGGCIIQHQGIGMAGGTGHRGITLRRVQYDSLCPTPPPFCPLRLIWIEPGKGSVLDAAYVPNEQLFRSGFPFIQVIRVVDCKACRATNIFGVDIRKPSLEVAFQSEEEHLDVLGAESPLPGLSSWPNRGKCSWPDGVCAIDELCLERKGLPLEGDIEQDCRRRNQSKFLL